MKRSKLFLGVTASLLAVAGFAAAKHQRHTVSFYYYEPASTCLTVSGTLTGYTETNKGQGSELYDGKQVFKTKVSPAANCSTPLYTGGIN